MTENNTPAIPQEWITIKTLKTVSGAALCCWLTTMFFDLVCFMPITNIKVHSLLILIITSISCLGLAIYKASASKGKKTKIMWMLVIPNAMLIYIHALGFHVASKELAMRANASEKKETYTQASVLSFLSFFAKQTSWIPNQELINKTQQFNKERQTLRHNNKILEDSIIYLNNQNEIALPITPITNNQDSTAYYFRLYKNCIKTNTILKGRMDSVDLQMKKLVSNIANVQSGRDKKIDSMLVKRIVDKNVLINRWNRLMESSGMALQKSEIERIMNGHMGDENYYLKLFRPIPVQ